MENGEPKMGQKSYISRELLRMFLILFIKAILAEISKVLNDRKIGRPPYLKSALKCV